MNDRLAAAAELADRLHGRPVQAIDVDDGRSDVPCFITPQARRSRFGDTVSCFQLSPTLALEQFSFVSRELLGAGVRRDALREVAETVAPQVDDDAVLTLDT